VPLSLAPLAKSLQWIVLLRADRSEPTLPTKVPASDPVAGPQIAILRLGWDAKEVKAMRLVAEVQHQLDGPPEMTGFEVPVVIVPPVLESNNSASVGELHYGEQHDAILAFWSATRPEFKLSVEDPTNDPCVVITPPRPLDAEEKAALPYELRSRGLITTQTRPRAAYAVKVTVHEHRNGRQLELGPIVRRLAVKTDAGVDLNITLTGVVRGGIQVGDANNRDRIDLGSFRANRPCEKTVLITSTESGIRLKVADKAPAALQVALEEMPSGAGARQWKLLVGVPADALAGVLPPDSAVYLETLSDQPRRIRIPVSGNATR
jgi:hypothetical protein